MFKSVAALVLGLTLSGVTAISHAELIIGVNSGYEPFEFIDKENKLTGFDIDLMNEICIELAQKCTYIDVPFGHLGAQLKLDQFTAIISAISMSEIRKKQIAFSEPYYSNPTILVGLDPNLTSMASLNGKSVGVLLESQEHLFLKAKYPEVLIESFELINQAIDSLNQGKISAVFADANAIKHFLEENPNMRMIGDPITDERYFGAGFGIGFKKNNEKMRESVNKALEKIKSSGRYQKIYDKWFTK